ncbi:MAG TPA: NUDIX domain-containing protein [Pyrinomonadaceae bacterium]|jgi:8-oxo-dGTP pyrophosphatase MutT (NUDIX family)|nr:NUDIX domain-containing protein [Pyrinomonadaceae bacterium]
MMTTADALTFGSPAPGVDYVERRAAYVVVVGDGATVATVASRQKHFLPGGGSLAGEAPEETVAREVREELARGVRLTRRLGEAVQYFYSDADGRHYRMLATFFAGELTGDAGAGEHELIWLPAEDAARACFHECHAWAVAQRSCVTPVRKRGRVHAALVIASQSW